MSQMERILYIDRCIRKSGKITIREVSDFFEVSVRQVKRDIEYMRDRLDAPLVYKKSLPGYIYEAPYRHLEFADQTLMLFYVVMKSLSENQHYIPVYTDEVLSKISEEVPKDYRNVCSHISYQMSSSENINSEFFMAICESLRRQTCLNLYYCNLKNEHSERLVEPEQLINYGGIWYLICFDHSTNTFRTFNMSRIEKVSETQESFFVHDEAYKTSLSDYLSGGFGIFKGNKHSSVTVRFYAVARRIVATQVWHPEQTVIENDAEDYTELTFPASDFTEVLSKILSFGKNARPIEPPELVALWKSEIQSLSSMLTQ